MLHHFASAAEQPAAAGFGRRPLDHYPKSMLQPAAGCSCPTALFEGKRSTSQRTTVNGHAFCFTSLKHWLHIDKYKMLDKPTLLNHPRRTCISSSIPMAVGGRSLLRPTDGILNTTVSHSRSHDFCDRRARARLWTLARNLLCVLHGTYNNATY